MKVVLRTTDNFRAAIVQGLLRDCEVEAELINENCNNIFPYSSVMSEMQCCVVVSDEYFERARQILSQTEEHSEVCPECGSNEVVFGIKGRNKYRKIFAVVLATLTLSPIGKIRPNYYCNNCKTEF